MTCTIGLIDGDRMWMGSDSRATNSDTGDYYQLAGGKVFRRGDMLIGGAGAIRMIDLLRYRLDIPERPKSMGATTWMATAFVNSVRGCFFDHGWSKKTENLEVGGQFLVAYEGRLFVIDHYFAVSQPKGRLHSVGSGAPYARGALSASSGHPRTRILNALGVAESMNAYVGRPFKVISMTARETGK